MNHPFPKAELIAAMRCEPTAMLPCKLDWPMRRIRYWGADPNDSRASSDGSQLSSDNSQSGLAAQWSDLWGITWRKESSDLRMLPFPVGHPLDASLDRLDAMNWPDANDPRRFAKLRSELQATPADSERLLVAEHPFAIYERAWLLMGMQPLLTAMVDVPDRVDELFARIGAFELGIARQYVALGVEAAWISDDYGMNSALMFSPEAWDRFVRPQLEPIVQCYHDAGALVVLHSCGNISPLVTRFVEIGVDVLDPLQPSCNQLDEVRAATAGQICLCGGVEASTLLAGDVKVTMLATHQRIAQLGKKGGYIVGPDDEWDYPPATREAMLKTVNIYRKRPAT